MRHGLYYLFLAYSAFTLYWLIRDDVEGKGFFGGLFAGVKTLIAPDSLLDKLVLLLWGNPWLVGIGVVILGGAVYARATITKAFSKFWFQRRFDLKPLV